jgi:hypothetical protein
MKIEWKCSACSHLNEENLSEWKKVRDGQGFVGQCINCNETYEIDISLNVYRRW